jgi:protoheme IX farnesyltransferase
MIGVTAWCGAWLAAQQDVPAVPASAIFGAVLSITALSAGASALNEVLERETDAKMFRTLNRPVVAGRVSALHAITAAVALSLCGLTYLALKVNLLTASLALLTLATYVAIYTPLKKITPQCTIVGAIPGAMPTVLGWAAVRGRVGLESLALFAVIFCWQFPHFYAIALLYRNDYERAGIRMLPLCDRDGAFTIALIRIFSLILVLASLVVGLFDKHPATYACIAILLGGGLLASTLSFEPKRTHDRYEGRQRGARQVLRATIIYLVLLFGTLIATHAC